MQLASVSQLFYLMRYRWLLTPPGVSVYSKLHPLKLYSNNVLSHLKVHYNSHMMMYSIIPFPWQPLECTQNVGDMLYVPSGWGHATINVDESIGFAVEFELLNC